MNQTVLNLGQFRAGAAVNPITAVSLPDIQAAVQTKPAAIRKPWWPIAAVVFGGILTLAWDGFLLWQVAQGFMYILGADF
jgi:hypothetical protein